MKKFDGYEKAEAFTGEYEKMETGGYVCKILQVKAEDKDYGTLLRIGFDILEGDKAGFYKRQFDKKKASKPDAKWPGMYYQTIKEDDLRYFKGFMTAIEESNPGYKWDWDEQKLKNKIFGGVFGEEEYEIQQGKREGEIGVSVKCMWVRSVNAIREGKYTVPEIKRLGGSGKSSSGFSAMDDISSDNDLPF
jgi:hypothetical protein